MSHSHPNASHIDETDWVSDSASGLPTNPSRLSHGVQPHRISVEQQWKSGKEACTKGYTGDSGSNLYDSSRTDSGFLSGANIVSDQFNSDEITSPRKSRELSGLQEEETNKGPSQSLMTLDSGVDVGLNDQISGLTIQDSSLNDLNAHSWSTKHSQESPTQFSNISVTTPIATEEDKSGQDYCPESWELYFQQDQEGDTQLHIAIIHGFIEVVYSLILMVSHPGYLDVLNDMCQTPLHLAVLTHQPLIVRRLLVAGATVDIRNRDGNTALHLACELGSLACVRALTEPVTVDEVNKAGLRYTIYQQQVPQDLEERNYDGQMCIHLAAQNGHVDVLRHLLWFGADVNAKEAKGGRTALHYAVEQGRAPVARFLLEECPLQLQLECATYAGLTAYQIAAAIDSAMARRLAASGARARSPPSDSDCDSEESDCDLETGDDEMYQKASRDNFSSFGLNGQPINISA